MKRLHVMLQVADLDRSIDFYSTLFASAPTKRRDGYAQWLLDDPRVNFSLSDRGTASDSSAAVGIEHLGIQAETADELVELRGRVDGLVTSGLVEGAVDEGETTCCYYRSDKSWITDAQGVSWELFHSVGESDVYAAGDRDCCADSCSDVSRSDDQRAERRAA